MLEALSAHWQEYLIEGALLGVFMIAACIVAVIFVHPRSFMSRRIPSPLLRRVVIGVLMGVTAICLIYSPWGGRSGAHMNPALTLTFLVLGKIHFWDAAMYMVAQFVGGCGGVLVARFMLGKLVAHEHVNFVATVPGRHGVRGAWLGEFAVAFLMMLMVLWSTNHSSTAGYTGVFAGLLVAMFITIEAPLSGMSMNPARTLASALPSRTFRHMWVYFTAPPIAMLCAAGVYVAVAGDKCVYCAKMNHAEHEPCLFNCSIEEMPGHVSNHPVPPGIQDTSGTSNLR